MTGAAEVRYVVLPGIVVKRDGDQVYVGNEAAGTGLECSAGVLDALSLLREPASIEAVARRSGLAVDLAAKIVAPLIDALLVVPEDSAAALAVGPTRAPSRVIGQYLPVSEVRRAEVAGAFAIMGAPTSVGAGPEGMPSHGPHLVRQAFPTFLAPKARPVPLREKWGLSPNALGLVHDMDFRRQYLPADLPRIFDLGDVIYEAGEGLDVYGARLRFVVERAALADMRPVIIGGDHSVTRYTVAAMLRRYDRIGIIHFDAHHDFYKGLPPKRLSHANPFSFLIREEGVASMLQIGLRAAFEHVDERARPVHDGRLQYVSALECQTTSAEKIFAHLPRDLPYYLSFDVDVMDPAYAPETGMPELGGLTYYQCLLLADHVARSFDVVGADLVEVGGSDRRVNLAARVASRVLAQILLGRSRFARLETYLYEHG